MIVHKTVTVKILRSPSSEIAQSQSKSSPRYRAETWPLKKIQDRNLEVEEVKMLIWMCGVTKLDKSRNKKIRGTVEAERKISKKIQERILQWNGHVKRRKDEYERKRVMSIEVASRI